MHDDIGRKVLGKILVIDLIRDIDHNNTLKLRIEFNGLGWGSTLYVDMEDQSGVEKLRTAMIDANKTTLEKMRNVPIEAHVVGMMVKDWRVLTEVI